jgi:hypothetical protein
MSDPFRILSALLFGLAVLLLMLAGCRSNNPPTPPAPTPVVTAESEGWGYGESREGKTAGIDYGCVLYWKWDGAVALAVWVDHDARTKGQAEVANGKGDLQGSLLTREGEPMVEIRCATNDGKAGRLTVGGQELDLSGGWLILVSADKGKVRVKQLARPPLQGAKGKAVSFQAMKGEPEIAAFFAPNPK